MVAGARSEETVARYLRGIQLIYDGLSEPSRGRTVQLCTTRGKRARTGVAVRSPTAAVRRRRSSPGRNVNPGRADISGTSVENL
jgi:hypothetical protein